jgi:hypothetical protein
MSNVRPISLRTTGALIVAVLTLTVPFPDAVDAGGPSTSCTNSSFCISRFVNPNGSTDTSMTRGWKQASCCAESSYDQPFLGVNDLSNDSYSNSGGVVAGNVGSIRNRDNINQRIMCVGYFVDDGESGFLFQTRTASFSFVGWRSLSSSGFSSTQYFWRGRSTSSC